MWKASQILLLCHHLTIARLSHGGDTCRPMPDCCYIAVQSVVCVCLEMRQPAEQAEWQEQMCTLSECLSPNCSGRALKLPMYAASSTCCATTVFTGTPACAFSTVMTACQMQRQQLGKLHCNKTAQWVLLFSVFACSLASTQLTQLVEKCCHGSADHPQGR